MVTAIDIDFVHAVVDHANDVDSPDHGEPHWRAVAATGRYLCHHVPDADPLVVFLFALFHDTRRESEWHDPHHGLRAADFALSQLYPSRLTSDQITALVVAIVGHDEGRTSDDPTVGVCWDADRLQLWRVGVVPDPELMSTDAGKRSVGNVFDFSQVTWDELLEGLTR